VAPSIQDSGSSRTEAPPARPLDGGRLRTVFLDLLGRPPLEAERETWSGRGEHELIEATLGTEEFWSHWYGEQLYYFLLIDSFHPASENARTIVPELAAGQLNVRDALHRIALTPSFDRRNPGADTFVTVVLEQLLGREVQKGRGELEVGKTLYDGGSGRFLGRSGKGQSDVVRIAIEDEDAMGELLARDHERLLRQPAERRDLRRWRKELHRDPWSYQQVVGDWLASASYASRRDRRGTMPNRMFVRALHVDLLDRLPEEDEAQAMRAALDGLADSRPLRSVLVRLLLDSGKAELPTREDLRTGATPWIAGRFERLLGREPSEDELRHFATVFHEQEECRPETIVFALLSSPEYHTY